MALQRIRLEYNQYLEDINSYYSIIPTSNVYIWDVILFGPIDSIFECSVFNCKLIFSSDYPIKPPVFKFITKLPHPNIYENGDICISILHEGVDISEYEDINERWSPTNSVHSILISILSVLVSPNLESPANLNISKLWKNNFNEYKKIIYKIISND